MAENNRTRRPAAGDRGAQAAQPDFGHLDHPDLRRARGHWHRRPAHHERRPNDHDRFPERRGHRGRQDPHQVQGREHRPGERGGALRRLHAGHGDREDRQACRRPDGRGRPVLDRGAAHRPERRFRTQYAALWQLHWFRSRQVQHERPQLPGARSRAGRYRPASRAPVCPEGSDPWLAGHRLSDLLPAAPSGAGDRLRSCQGRQVHRDQGLRQCALRPVRQRGDPVLEREWCRCVGRRWRIRRAHAIALCAVGGRTRVRHTAVCPGHRGGSSGHGVRDLQRSSDRDEAAGPSRGALRTVFQRAHARLVGGRAGHAARLAGRHCHRCRVRLRPDHHEPSRASGIGGLSRADRPASGRGPAQHRRIRRAESAAEGGSSSEGWSNNVACVRS